MNLLLTALVAVLSAVQAQPQRASASIEGIVVKFGTGEPLANASVQLSLEVSDDRRSESSERPLSPESPPREQLLRKTTSDANGHFIFEPGRYYVVAKPDIAELRINLGQPYNAAMVHVTPPHSFWNV